jgi:hypothetical protein
MFPMNVWTNISTASTPFIYGNNLHDVAISGSGTIDGNAGFSSGSTSNWWGVSGANNPESPRPEFLNMYASTNLLVQGVTLQNPPVSHFVFKSGDTNVTIQGVLINTVTNSPNTDSEFGCENMLIENCTITCGDDNLVTGGSGITISNCTFHSGHGLTIGSYTTDGGMNNLLVSNCTWNGTEYGIHLKSARGRGGLVQNLTYRDLTMTNVNFVVAIYSYYDVIGSPSRTINVTPYQASTDTAQSVTSTTPIWQNITITNVTASTLGGNIAGIIWGLPEMLVSNVTIAGVNISDPTKTFCVYNATGIRFIDSNMTAPTTGTNTFTIYNAGITITNSTPSTNTVTLWGLGSPSNSVLALFNGQVETADASVLGASPLLTLASSTLTVSNSASFGGSSKLNFGLGTNATKTVATGNLTLGGTLNVADAGGFNSGTYTLFTYGGALTYNGLTVGTTPNTNFTYTVSTNTHGQVNLVVSSSCSVGAAGSISGLASVAAGTNGVTYSISSVSGATTYTWTVPTGATIASGLGTTSITVNYACTASSGNVQVTPSNGSCSGTAASLGVTVTGVGAAGSISGPASVNAGTNGVNYSISSVSGATTYTWTVPSSATIASGQGTTSITVNYACTASSGNVQVTPSNANGCSGTTASLGVTVTGVGVAGSISGPTTVCAGQTGAVYSISSVDGATTYTWSVPSGATITGGQGTISITVTWGSSSGNVQVTPSNANSCAGAGSSLTVTVNAAPGITSNPSPQTVCAGGTVAFTVSATGAGLSYQWQKNGSTINDGGTISGSATFTLTLTGVGTGDSGASFDCVVSGTCSPPATSGGAALTVNASPATFNVTGGGSYCAAGGGVTVGLDESESSADYQLELNGNPTGTTVTGTGSAISFTNQTAVGTYTVIASSVTSGCTVMMNGSASVTSGDPFTCWQLQYFQCTACPQAQPNADPLGKGMSNTNQFLVGLDPTNSASLFRIVSVVPQGTNAVITWTTAGGHTNAVQVTGGDANGGYNTNSFADLPASRTVLPGSGDTSTNYVDAGGATNAPSRYYRIRLVP